MVRFLLCTILSALAVAPASAQCLGVLEGFGASGVRADLNGGAVFAAAVFDDGGGEQLYVGGWLDVAGEVRSTAIARWDGAHWSALADGITDLSPRVFALRAFDDGSGPALYVGGQFSSAGNQPAQGAARWSDAGWEALPGLGSGGVLDLEVFDDGSGPALYAGGNFTTVAGQPCRGLARWTGSTWAPVGAGPGTPVTELEPFTSGGSTKLYIGGRFALPTGVGNRIATWDGAQYATFGAGMNDEVSALRVHDDGSGPALFVGGSFTTIDGLALARLAKWDGASWSSAGDTHGMHVEDLLEFDDGGGARLFAACSFDNITPSLAGPSLQVRNGATWSEVGGGLQDFGFAYALASFDDGAGEALYVGGQFQSAGGQHIDSIAKWDGSQFSALGPRLGRWGASDACATHDDGAGVAIYVDDGHLLWTLAGSASVERVERITSGTATATGDRSDGDVRDLQSFDGGAGAQLYAAGTFTRFGAVNARGVAAWNGSSWLAVGGSLSIGGATALEVADLGAGEVLVLGGFFDSVGGVAAKNVAVWNGSTWSALGAGLSGAVNAFASFDDGGGTRLYAGGAFTNSGGVSVKRIAMWDGSLWQPLGSGASASVNALKVFDDGTGPQLYAGGAFLNMGGVPLVFGIARWSGSSWSALSPAGPNGYVHALELFHDGLEPQLFVGGDFWSVKAAPGTRGLARFDGAAWSSVLGVDVRGGVRALAVLDDGVHAASLWLAGDFGGVGEAVSVGLAQLGPECPCPPVAYCTPKVNSQGCTPSIFATGTPSFSANTLRVRATNVLNQKSSVLFWGFAPNAAPFQQGTLCVRPPTIRTPVQNAGGNPGADDCSGNYVFHFSGSYMTSLGLSPSQRVYCQYWTRDPASPSTTGLTDGLWFTTCP